MATAMRDGADIVARLVYYGAEQSGKSTNVQYIHRKLKKDHRGELRVTQIPGTRASFEVLPVELGQLHGHHTSIYVHSVPGGAEHSEVRRRILDQADGIVFVADLRPERHAATEASLHELRAHLATYGRNLDHVVLVVQYNHRDQADENAVEALHRRLPVKPAASFEAVATAGNGVLQTLTAISKLIVADLRARAQRAPAAPAPETLISAPEPAPVAAPVVEAELEPISPEPLPAIDDEPRTGTADLSAAVRSEPEPAISAVLPAVSIEGKDLSIESVGPSDCSDSEVRIPIRLVHATAGRIELCLRLSLKVSAED
jgi:mutual gliding-motility protein MglA